MSFLTPVWLLALGLIFAYFYAVKRLGYRADGSQRWLLVSMVLLIVALARPVLEQKPVSIEQMGSDVIIAVDLSYSMRATDVAPNRLSAAKTLLSDLVRSEYIVFDGRFEENFLLFLDELAERADHYEMMAEQLERNPVLSIDYLKRAFLLTNEQGLKERALQTLQSANLQDRAKNSVEVLAASF